MKVKTNTPLNFWKKEEDIDNKEREFIEVGTNLEISDEVYESRLKNYVDVIETKTPKGILQDRAKELDIDFVESTTVAELKQLIEEKEKGAN